MKQDLSDKRKDYDLSRIDYESAPDSPLEMFRSWYERAQNSDLQLEPYAVSVSAIDAEGFPRTRIVLLREFNDAGFVFYTNYNSQKGKAIEANPHVCLSFFWDKLEQQIIIKGLAEKVNPAMSDDYFHKRPVDNQIGAMVSKQSSVIGFDRDLEDDSKKLEKELAGMDIKRPDYWGGFLVRPVEIEFWQGRPSRLHDRLRYRLENGNWLKERLSP